MRFLNAHPAFYAARIARAVAGLCCALVIIASAPSHAQNTGDMPVIDWSLLNPPSDREIKAQADRKQTRENFYAQCIAMPTTYLPLSEHLAMCACIDAHRVAYESRGNDLDWRNRVGGRQIDEYTDFNVSVVAPCLYLMGESLSNQECYTARYRNMFRNPPALAQFCACRAREITKYLQDTAEPRLAALAAQGRAIDDPLAVLHTDMDYRRQSSYLTQSCLHKYYDPNPPSKNAPRSGGYYNG